MCKGRALRGGILIEMIDTDLGIGGLHVTPRLVSFRNGEIVDPPGSRAARSASSSGRRHRLGYAGTHEEAVFPWLESIVEGELVDSDA